MPSAASATDFYLLTGNGQDAHRVVGAICDQRQRSGLVDHLVGGLFADVEGLDDTNRLCRQIDDVDLIIRHEFPLTVFLNGIERIGDDQSSDRV